MVLWSDGWFVYMDAKGGYLCPQGGDCGFWG